MTEPAQAQAPDAAANHATRPAEPHPSESTPHHRVLSSTGDGAPIVFLHGLLESSAIWQPLVARNTLPWSPAVALSLPGHAAGDTLSQTGAALRDGRYLGSYARTLERLFPGGRWRLVGHSTGGFAALQLAQRYPEKVEDILLIGALFQGEVAVSRSMYGRLATLPGLGPLLATLGGRLGLASGAVFQSWGAAVQAPNRQAAPLPDAMRRDLAACDPLALLATLTWLHSQCMKDHLPAVRCPVTCIVGTEDPIVPASHQIELLKTLPNARAWLLSAGHLPFLEAPEIFDPLFRQWAHPALLPPRR